jgi:hypothetical protein
VGFTACHAAFDSTLCLLGKPPRFSLEWKKLRGARPKPRLIPIGLKKLVGDLTRPPLSTANQHNRKWSVSEAETLILHSDPSNRSYQPTFRTPDDIISLASSSSASSQGAQLRSSCLSRVKAEIAAASPRVYDAGNCSAAWSIGNSAFCKVKRPMNDTNRELTTLEFVQKQQPGFKTPNILHQAEHNGRS